MKIVITFLNNLIKKDTIDKQYNIFDIKVVFVKLILICKWDSHYYKAIVSKSAF